MKRQLARTALIAAASLVLLTACAGGELPPSAFPGVTVDGNYAYLASNFHLYKFDLQTGAVVWKFPAAMDNAKPIGPFSGVPLKYGDWIVIGGSAGMNGAYDRHVYAVSEATGVEAWRFSGGTREFVDGVVSDGKIIYAPSGDGSLYAIDPMQRDAAGEPKLVWKFTTGNRLWSRPLLADGILYQASFDHKLYAINAASGKELWRFEGATAAIGVMPALVDGTLYFGSFDSHAYAVNATNGQLKWKTAVNSWIWTDPTVYQGSVYVADVRGRAYALNAETGQQQWTFDTQDTVKGRLVLDDDKLFVVSMDTFAYALDPTGSRKNASGHVEFADAVWRNDKIGRRLVSKPAVHGGDLIIPLLDSDIKMWALDKTTGDRKMQFPPPAATPEPGK